MLTLPYALNRLEEWPQAGKDFQMLTERIVLTPGSERSEMFAALHCQRCAILQGIERKGIGNTYRERKPAASAAGLSLSLVAGAGSNLHLRPEQVKMVAGTGVDHNLRSTPAKMVAGACTHLNLLFRTAA